MNNFKSRIFSKFGLLLVFIGFFMPITYNLNGFEIARTLETFGGTNLISISLYVIFVGSCVGLFLLLLLIMRIKYSVNYDWLNLILVAIVYILLVFIQLTNKDNSFYENFKKFQSGAFIILFGLLLSFVSLFLVSYSKITSYSIKTNAGTKNYSNKELNVLEEKLISLIGQEKKEEAIEKYYDETGKEWDECELYIEKLIFFKEHKLATEDEWNKELEHRIKMDIIYNLKMGLFVLVMMYSALLFLLFIADIIISLFFSSLSNKQFLFNISICFPSLIIFILCLRWLRKHPKFKKK